MADEIFPEVPVDVLVAKYEAQKAQATETSVIEKYGRYINVLRTLVMFLSKNSTKFETIDKLPVIDGEVLHVSDLFMEIANRGGYHWKQEAATNPEYWPAVCRAIGIQERHADYIHRWFKRYLLPYETAIRAYKKMKAEQSKNAAAGGASGQSQDNTVAGAPSTATAGPTPASAMTSAPMNTMNMTGGYNSHMNMQNTGSAVSALYGAPQNAHAQMHNLAPNVAPVTGMLNAPVGTHMAPSMQQTSASTLTQNKKMYDPMVHPVTGQPLPPGSKPLSVYMIRKLRAQAAAEAAKAAGGNANTAGAFSAGAGPSPVTAGYPGAGTAGTIGGMMGSANMTGMGSTASGGATGVAYSNQYGRAGFAPGAPTQMTSGASQYSTGANSGMYGTSGQTMPTSATSQAPMPAPTTGPVSSSSAPVPSSAVSLPEPPAVAGFVKENITEAQWPARIHEAVKQINSTDPALVIKGLNALLVKSSEWDSTYVLQLDMYPDLILALGSLLDAINPIGGLIFPTISSSAGRKRKAEEDEIEYMATLIGDHQHELFSWQPFLPGTHNAHYRALSTTLDDNPLLLNTLAIIRNLSFEACNEVPISSSYPIMRHLVTILISSYGSLVISEAAQLVLDTILNISGRWDLTGEKRLSATHFLDDCLADPRQIPLIRMRTHKTMTLMSKLDYGEVVKGMLSYIFNSLQQTVDMTQTLRGLDLLAKLAGNSDNAEVFAICPEEVLEYLVDLLCTNTTAVEPFHISEKTTLLNQRNAVTGGNSVVQQQGASKKGLRMPAATGQFHSFFSDNDVRDQTLEAMYVLCQYVPEMRVRLAHTPKCLKLLVKIVASRENKIVRAASDPSIQKATNILSLMAQKQSENLMKFKTVWSELALGAFSDDALQEVFCGSVLDLLAKEHSAHGALAMAAGAGDSIGYGSSGLTDGVGMQVGF